MKHLKTKGLFLLAILCLTLTSCNKPAVSPGNTSTEPAAVTDTDTSTEAAAVTDTDASTEGASATDTSADSQAATLYIGTRNAGFVEYPLTYEGDLTPELLIQGIADLTGWDLTLAEPVTTGKGGMSVCLSKESALFVGPPEPQKDEFYMFSADQLAETILDSIQRTLQKGFTGEGGDPDALDIYYYMEGEQPLELPNLGLSWPLDEPYHWRVHLPAPAQPDRQEPTG